MKKIASLLLALVLLTGLVGTLSVSAAGSASISANKSSVNVGGTVTVTASYSGGGAGIGSLDAYFHYNAKVFEYVSCSGATAAGGAGSIKMSYFCQDITAPKSVTVSVTLKAIATGSGNFKWETEGMYDDEDNLLGNPGKSLSVSATNPTKSGDATLSYLRPSKGTLVPQFDKNVTEYTVTVPHSVNRGLLNFSTTDPHATSVITNNADLAVGKTTRVITVTAQNGTTKKYTIVFTREAAPSTTTGKNPTGSTTTTTAPVTPPKDVLEVEVDGKPMVIAGDQPAAKLPDNFKWDFVSFGGVDVPAAKHNKAELTLLYLMEQEGDGAGFYLYDAATDTFAPYRKLTVNKAVYSVHNLPDNLTAPAGTITGTFTYKAVQVSAFVYEDEALKDYAILYVTTPEGETGLYTFDSVERTFQRYVAPTVTPPEASTPDTPVDTEEEQKPNGILKFFEEYRTVLLVGAAALGGMALLILAIILLLRVCSGGKRKGKH